MMKLYYAAGSCSTSCHISLEESGLPYKAIEVDFDNENDANIAVVTKLNPLGTLPILITDDGKQLDQNLAIHTYIAEQAPVGKLFPAAGTFERAQALNWLAFVTSDMHKSIGGLFGTKAISENTVVQEAYRNFMAKQANGYIKYLDDKLAGKDYMLGKDFSPADAYALVVLNWTKWVELPLTPYKNVEAYMARIAARPAVMKVMKEEGLLEG